MAYWLDDGFDTWPETVRAGKAAAGLYVCCGAWIARGISNGTLFEAVVPAEIATMYGTPEWVAKLVSVGLWRVEGAGYRDVRYHSMGNPTAEKVAEQKAQKKARQAKWLEKQGKKTRRKTVSSQSRDASLDASKDSAPSLIPSKEGKGAQAPPSPFVAEDVHNPDWRQRSDFVAEPDPHQAERTHSRMAEVRSQIRVPQARRDRPGPVEVARQRGSSLDALDEVLAQVIPLHQTEVPDVEAG